MFRMAGTYPYFYSSGNCSSCFSFFFQTGMMAPEKGLDKPFFLIYYYFNPLMRRWMANAIGPLWGLFL